jgi:peptidoglycan hydrolase-like protein with peptidoglycan-binding domain
MTRFGIEDSDAIKKLQELLSLDQDGQYGPKTLASVKEFQSINGLTPDGIVGPATWNILGVSDMPTLSPPANTPVVAANTGHKIQTSTITWSTAEATRQLQNMLGVSADGQFGPQTTAAVKNFQQKNGISPDGVVGPQTWFALFSTSGITGPINPPTLKATSGVSPAPAPSPTTPVQPMNLGQPNPLSVKPTLMSMGNWPIWGGVLIIGAALYEYMNKRDSGRLRRG